MSDEPAGDAADDDGPAVAQPDDDAPPAFTVRGGVGGTTACLIALVTSAARAEKAAAHLAEAGRLAARVREAVEVTQVFAPVTGAHAAAAVGRVTDAPGGVGPCADALVRVASALRGAAETYARADRAAEALLRVPVVLAGAVGGLGPGTTVGPGVLGVRGLLARVELAVVGGVLRATPTPVGLGLRWLGTDEHRRDDGPLGLLARLFGGPGLLPDLSFPAPRELEALLPAVAAYLLGLAPGPLALSGRPVAQAAAALAVVGTMGAGLLGVPRPGLVVAPLVGRQGGKGRASGKAGGLDEPPASIADVLRAVDLVADDVHGAVGVQCITHPDGSRSWVVLVPGTQEVGLGGAAPTDMGTNLELVGGLPDDRTATVLEAMRQAGIRPGEPVLLAGHSQGGMAVVRVAEAAGDDYSVAGVLTAGSPVGGMVVPDGIPALHLEHAQDYVPAADGAPNPDQPNRTTVTRDLAVPLDGEVGWPSSGLSLGDRFAGPHELTAYIQTAELVTQQGDRSVQAFLDAVAPVLGDGAPDATTQRYLGVRVPDDASGLVDWGAAPAASGAESQSEPGAKGKAKRKATSWS